MEIILNAAINAKALLILKEREEREKKYRALVEYIERCVDANICPVCGEPLRKYTKKKHCGHITYAVCTLSESHYNKCLENVNYEYD